MCDDSYLDDIYLFECFFWLTGEKTEGATESPEEEEERRSAGDVGERM